MKNFKITISFVLLLVSNIGCRKFVELGPPDTLLVNDNVYANDETAIGAMVGIYSDMVDRSVYMPYQLSVLTGLLSDELESPHNGWTQAYENALFPLDSPTNPVWTAAYSWIFQSNLVYEGCENSSALNPLVKKQLMGEARFIRAYWLFYLVNLYGDVPVPITTDYATNATLYKRQVTEVYELIVSDLKYAKENLNEKYVGANTMTETSDRVRPNKSAATALLARTYLYMNDYINAEIQASILIDNKADFDLVALNNVFLKASREAIWQLMKPTSTGNDYVTPEGYGFILNGPPALHQYGSSTISGFLFNAFDNADKRKSTWIGKYTDTKVTPNKDYYFPNKYKIYQSSSVSELSTVFRLAEQILIRAEARAQLNKLSGAVADVDLIRDRAGIDKIALINPSISKDDLLAVILKERQRELFTEWGHRWMDLKRSNKIDVVMSSVVAYKKTTWSSFKQFWPIPQKDLDRDVNLKQNNGY